jgi:outer membrane lipoprotein-sorting protein
MAVRPTGKGRSPVDGRRQYRPAGAHDRTVKVALPLTLDVTDASDSGLRGLVSVRLVAIVSVLLLAGVGVGMAFTAPAEPTADGIVTGVEERYDDADSYVGTVEISATYENESGTYDRSATARVQSLAPDRHRVEVLAPERYNGTVAATNGSAVWVARGAGTAAVQPLNATQQDWLSRANVSAAVDRLRENATVEKTGTATVDGHETYVLAVTPDNESYDANATVYVDTDDYRVRKVEAVASHDGETVRTTMHFRDFTFGVDIHESTFQPPTDRSVVVASLDRTSYDSLDAAAADLNFSVATPTVPADFAADRVVVSRYGEDATLTSTYTNGSDTIAVIQSERNPLSRLDTDGETVTVGSVEATYVEVRDAGVVFWEADGRTYAVAGSVDRSTLVGVADSVAE